MVAPGPVGACVSRARLRTLTARTLCYVAEGSSHECQDGPAAQHSQDVDRDNQESDRLGEVPGQEIDRDDTRVLSREDANRHQKSQEDKACTYRIGAP